LRCAALLVETPAAAAPDPGVAPGRPTGIVVAGIAGAIGALAVFIWVMRPMPIDDEVRPYTGSTAGRRTASTPAVVPEVPVPAEAAFIDSTRAGSASFTQGDFESARASYEAALANNPDDPAALNNLAQALLRTGDLDGAVARLQRAVELAPDEWEFRFNLAHAATRLSQWDRAVAEYRVAARLFPADYATQYNLAMALQRSGDISGSIPELRRAIELAPAEASFHVALGNAYHRVGRLEEARGEFEAFLQQEPDSPEAARVKAHIEELTAAAAGAGRGGQPGVLPAVQPAGTPPAGQP
jgi:Flp pilus assembly protein TadD